MHMTEKEKERERKRDRHRGTDVYIESNRLVAEQVVYHAAEPVHLADDWNLPRQQPACARARMCVSRGVCMSVRVRVCVRASVREYVRVLVHSLARAGVCA